jgi:RimJ/RimL family protein N-acetyltransferase
MSFHTRIINKMNFKSFLKDIKLVDAYYSLLVEYDQDQSNYSPPRETYIESIVRGLKTGNELILLFDKKGGALIASCTLWPPDPWNTVQIEQVGVVREHRGKGWCAVLVREAVNLAAKMKRGRVRIYCHTTNSPACRCYSSVFGKPMHTTAHSTAWELLLY